MDAQDRLLTIREVEAFARLSKPTIYILVKRGEFPRQLRLGPNRVAWLKSEVLAWIEDRAAAREVQS